MQKDSGYWFPMKRYGWGWGLPLRWQGWVVYIAFAILLLAGRFAVAPAYYVPYVVILCLALIVICWWKGEPPRWRWGGDDRA